jgi:hypothetical protein
VCFIAVVQRVFVCVSVCFDFNGKREGRIYFCCGNQQERKYISVVLFLVQLLGSFWWLICGLTLMLMLAMV